MQPTEIIITNILATKTAFAVRADDMTANIFLPSKLSLEFNLRPGMKVMASLVPNVQQPDKTPWLAIALHGMGQDATPDVSLRDRIRVELGNGPATAYELAKFLDVRLGEVQDELRAMRLPSTDLWALDMRELTEVQS
jgi:hypothetical protein